MCEDPKTRIIKELRAYMVEIKGDGVVAKIKEIMLKWDNLIREEYGQKLTEEICNVYGKSQTLLSVIEMYYGITI